MAKVITTTIVINATPEKVWSVLTQFNEYPVWNPFIKSIQGVPKKGENIVTTIKLPNSNAMKFKPVVLAFDKEKLFQWKGKLFISGLFDGTHSFELKDNNNGTTTFIHSESFSGILVSVLWKMLKNNTHKGFEMMNEALKNRVEIKNEA